MIQEMNDRLSSTLLSAFANAVSIRDNLIRDVYKGPIALAGGFYRDVALGNRPKDIDIFLLDTYVKDALELGDKLERTFYPFHSPTGSIVVPCYGTWAEDLDYIIKAAESRRHSIDIVVLNSTRFEDWCADHGWSPSKHMHKAFLRFVLDRLDLRINALGASSEESLANPSWTEDAANHRLVLQREVRTDAEHERMVKRLRRLTEGKFSGWTVWEADDEGGLRESEAYSDLRLRDGRTPPEPN